jgi:acyl carrier protein
MTNEEIYGRIRTTLIENFEIPAERISLEARLGDDLELDSIDAIDMAVQIQELTGARLEEDELRKLRTVGDTVELVARLIAAKAPS